jgi:pyruvate dehydrogenase (quinone)
VAKALLGKDVLSDELPYVTGSIGLLGTRPSYELMQGCDTLLTVGSSFPYTQFMPGFGQARAVQIDIDGRYLGMRYPYELNLVGDARAALRALIPLLDRKQDRTWREDIEAKVTRWWETMEQEAMVEADPVNPMRLFHELSVRLPDNAILAADSGSSANWYARQLKFRGQVRGSLSGNLATMGPGVPYGIGAKFGHPDRPVIVFEGDGAMQMNGLAELITIKHYWEQRADPRLIVAVLHNDDLNQVTWEMRAMEGAPKFTESQTLPDVDYAAFATSLGLQGIYVDKPMTWAPPGTGRWPPTGPCCLTSGSTRASRRYRPTPRSNRPRPPPRRCWAATRTPVASSSRASRPRCRSSCRIRGTDGRPCDRVCRGGRLHRADRCP